MENYKQEIIDSRTGALGSSDGKLLQTVASLGYVPQTLYKRLAVAKGLIENEQIPYTVAVQAGDTIEQAIFEHLAQSDSRYQSNPLLASKKFSRPNIKLISHPDILLVDEENKTIHLYEVKTTKRGIEETRNEYRAQLFIHSMLAKELACEKGHDWKVKLALVHYDTNGLDLENGVEFDPDRITLRPILMKTALFDLNRAMDIVNGFLGTFNEYYPEDEVDYSYLPAPIQEQFAAIATALTEIKEREQKVGEFKEKLYEFLRAKNIKSIRGESITITRVEPSVSKSFDHKRYLDDYAAKHPTKFKRLVAQYEKTTNKKGYALIKLK